MKPYSTFPVTLCGVALCALSFVFLSESARALPIETFSSPVSIECDDDLVCDGFSRSDSTLGRYVGIVLTKSSEGEVSATVEKKASGTLVYRADESPSSSLTFTWDGDPHPRQLSGSGLNCLDLTRQGASAVVLSSVAATISCGDDESRACAKVSFESRVYDARDPTGQRFSMSYFERELGEREDVFIPFSNFTQGGPRGRASFECVGAITLLIRFEGVSDARVEFGPIFTNGSEGLTPIPTATPTLTPAVSPTQPPATATVEVMPTEPPTALPTGEDSVSTTPVDASSSPTGAPTVGESTAVPPTAEPRQAPEVRPALPAIEEEEAVYGEVVSGVE